MIFPILVL